MRYCAGCGLELYEDHESETGMCDECVELRKIDD